MHPRRAETLGQRWLPDLGFLVPGFGVGGGPWQEVMGRAHRLQLQPGANPDQARRTYWTPRYPGAHPQPARAITDLWPAMEPALCQIAASRTPLPPVCPPWRQQPYPPALRHLQLTTPWSLPARGAPFPRHLMPPGGPRCGSPVAPGWRRKRPTGNNRETGRGGVKSPQQLGRVACQRIAPAASEAPLRPESNRSLASSLPWPL